MTIAELLTEARELEDGGDDRDACVRYREAIESLQQRILEDNAFCACGCPAREHESLGEDGEGCENEAHRCYRVCAAALVELTEERQRTERAEADVDAWRDRCTKAEQELAIAGVRGSPPLGGDEPTIPRLLRERRKAEAERDEAVGKATEAFADSITKSEARVAELEAEKAALVRKRDELRDLNHEAADVLERVISERDAALRERDEARAGSSLGWLWKERDAAQAEAEKLRDRLAATASARWSRIATLEAEAASLRERVNALEAEMNPHDVARVDALLSPPAEEPAEEPRLIGHAFVESETHGKACPPGQDHCHANIGKVMVYVPCLKARAAHEPKEEPVQIIDLMAAIKASLARMRDVGDGSDTSRREPDTESTRQ